MPSDVGPVKLNHDTLLSLLQGGLGMDAVLKDEAQKVLERAKATAPVETGEYKDSLHIEQAATGSTHRRVYRIVSSDPKAGIIEHFHGTLTRALAASSGKRGKRGLKVVKGGK